MSIDAADPAVQKAFEAEVNAGTAAVEAEDLSGDGGVMKTILKEGTSWEKPVNGIEVAVHYTGTLLSGEKFDSSVDRGEHFKFKLGAGQVIKGWDITVASMRRGEKCRVVLASQYAYGAHGSPPKIPGGATLVFEIELFEFDNEVDITKEKNGSIKKLETKPPTGPQIPEYDSVVKVEYSVNDTNGVELSEKRTVSFTMGDETFPAGVQFAISSIRMGGAAKFTIRPSQAYGAEGNADLKIPGNSTTVWHIEVLELESPADPSTLSSAEKLTIANQKKTEGNTLFAQGKFKRALDKYDFAASYTKFVPGEEGKQAEEIRTICRLNAAQCLLKLQLFSDAEKRCTEVLKAEPTNIKGLYRRALALHAQGNLAAASADLKLLVATDSTHQEAVRELSKVSAKIKAQEDKERQLYARMFQ